MFRPPLRLECATPTSTSINYAHVYDADDRRVFFVSTHSDPIDLLWRLVTGNPPVKGYVCMQVLVARRGDYALILEKDVSSRAAYRVISRDNMSVFESYSFSDAKGFIVGRRSAEINNNPAGELS
jgi:hypothetical protein